MSEPETTIVEATGYGGGSSGLALPLIEIAMQRAAADCMALGIFDDAPPERVAELTGVEGKTGSQFILDSKMAARAAAKAEHRALISAHEALKAAALHATRDAE